MTTTIDPLKLAEAVATLRSGGLVAFPTETVYGLGADATNSSAVRRIFEVKGRPSSNPLIVHISSFNDLARYADLSRSFDRKLTEHRLEKLAPFWPGPLSIVLPAGASIAREVRAGGDTVALRVPRHPVALALLRAFDGPIAAPSANASMYISPTTVEHVREALGTSVDCIIDGGACEVGLESTVLSLLELTPRVLRPGAITREQIAATLGCTVEGPIAASNAPLQSPGLMAKHYAPHTPVMLKSALRRDTKLPKKVGAILFSPQSLAFSPSHTTVLSPGGELKTIAANLFQALREHDQLALDLIIVDTCEPIGLGEAIMDRLLRASHR